MFRLHHPAGEVSPVTAGRFVLDQTRTGLPLGRFVYGRSYLDPARAVAIDPVELKLSRGRFETAQLNGVFGALRDASPDYWGRRIIEKHAGKTAMGELDTFWSRPTTAPALSASVWLVKFNLHLAPHPSAN